AAPAGARARGELVQAGPARIDPPLMVALAHPADARRAPAVRNPARRPAEDRVPGIEDEHVSAELRPDRGQQPLQQPVRAPGMLARVLAVGGPAGGGAHLASSKTDAKIRTRTSPRRPAACSRVVPPPPGHSR